MCKKMCKEPKYLVAGEKALVVEFGNKICEEINNKVKAMMIAIERKKIKGIVEILPTYRSLMIHYNPLEIDYESLLRELKVLENKLDSIRIPLSQVIEIPIVYGGVYGPDIHNVAKYNGLIIENVIKIHSSKEYLIYMLGFTPGFPYLGGMDERIATPRIKVPRTKISGGSVGIAGNQTGIYPIDSPGGWQIIGKTPLKLYDPYREPPILLKAGNYIKFTQISEEEYIEIEKQIDNNSYKYKTYTKERQVK